MGWNDSAGDDLISHHPIIAFDAEINSTGELVFLAYNFFFVNPTTSMPARTVTSTLTDTPSGLIKTSTTKSITFTSGLSSQFIEGFSFASIGDTVVITIPSVAADYSETGTPDLEPTTNLTFVISAETFAAPVCQNICDPLQPTTRLIRDLSDSGICVTTDREANATKCQAAVSGNVSATLLATESAVTDSLDIVSGLFNQFKTKLDTGGQFMLWLLISTILSVVAFRETESEKFGLVFFMSSLVIGIPLGVVPFALGALLFVVAGVIVFRFFDGGNGAGA